MWGWTADHDLDGIHGQTISTGRGFLVEATAATWLHGTASEHNTLYQYNFNYAANVFVGMQQSETAYWQGPGSSSLAPAPWATLSSYGDPTFTNCGTDDAQCRMGWFARLSGCNNIFFYGAGFWTFFNDNDGSCQAQGVCQTNAIDIRNMTSIAWFGINVKDNINVIYDNGAALVTEKNNPGGSGGFGKNGAVVGAFLMDSIGSPLLPPPGQFEQVVYWYVYPKAGRRNGSTGHAPGPKRRRRESRKLLPIQLRHRHDRPLLPLQLRQRPNPPRQLRRLHHRQQRQRPELRLPRRLPTHLPVRRKESLPQHRRRRLRLRNLASKRRGRRWNSYASPSATSGAAPRAFGHVFVNG
jgi:hypothetical protein